MNAELALRAYDEQVRQSMVPPQPGWQVELAAGGSVLRVISPPDHEWGCFVIWSDLDDASADGVIAEQVDFFRRLGRKFEWKWHGYDQPGDLRPRLEKAGFVAAEDESLIVGEVESVVDSCAGAPVADGVTLRHVRMDDLDVDFAGMAALSQQVWDDDFGWLMTELRAELLNTPDDLRIHVAEVAGEIVCAAWVRFHAGTDFASLWGGSTLPEWRRKGIYRALVGRRAVQARDRGFQYLQVDASPESRPILERLGLTVLTGTTPYMWTP